MSHQAYPSRSCAYQVIAYVSSHMQRPYDTFDRHFRGCQASRQGVNSAEEAAHMHVH